MRIGVDGRAGWSAVVALVAGLMAGGTRTASAQEPVEAVNLAVAGPRFLALEVSHSSDAAPRWTDASNAAVFRKVISVDLRDVPLAQALSVIAQRAGLRLTYSAAVVPLDARVTFSASQLTVGAVLSAVLYDAGVDVLLTSHGQAALVKRGTGDELQVGAITGRITDSASAQGIVAATVAVEGTALSARSAGDGSYRIANVPPGSYTVKVTRIGYRAASKPVTVVSDQDVSVDFVVAAQATQLEEVVAIGYGTAERRELTGAVSSVTADQLSPAPVTSLDQALQGRAPGVEVVTSSGQPGAGAMVRIRGGNSIAALNDPLYVIDGVPVTTNLNEATTNNLFSEGMRGLNPIGAVDPNDIESIEVLKDASAVAIYGARGANGVVLISTKRGRARANAVFVPLVLGAKAAPRPPPTARRDPIRADGQRGSRRGQPPAVLHEHPGPRQRDRLAERHLSHGINAQLRPLVLGRRREHQVLRVREPPPGRRRDHRVGPDARIVPAQPRPDRESEAAPRQSIGPQPLAGTGPPGGGSARCPDGPSDHPGQVRRR